MVTLTKVRNYFVHYKMDLNIKGFKDLEDRGLALPKDPSGVDHPWTIKLSSSEGIRWANNTVCKVASAFFEFIPEDKKPFLFGDMATNFQEISENVVLKKLELAGIRYD